MGGFSGGVPDQQLISKLALLLAGNKDARNDQEEMPGAAALTRDPSMGGVAPSGGAAPAASTSMPTTTANPAAATPAAVIMSTQSTLPTAPVPPVIDAAARQKLATPTDPNVVKPKWYDRLFGGMATFGAAMQHNPNAIELGSDIVNKRYTTAESLRQKQLGAFDANTAAQKENYQGQRDVFSDHLKAAEEERRRTSAGALDTERIAKANRQDYLSMSPQERAAQVSDLEKTSGMTFTQGQKSDFILTGKIPSSANKSDDVIGQREKDADRIGLKGDDRKFYLANGKLREAFESGRAPTDLETWTAAFRRDNKREPTADEIAQRKAVPKSQATFKDSQSIDKYSDKWYAAQRDAVRKDKGQALKNAGGKPADAQAEYQQIEDSYKQRAQEFEDRKKDWYAQVKNGKPVSVDTQTHDVIGESNHPTASAAPKNGGGKQLDAATAKSILAEAGGDKDRARQIAKSRNYKF